LLSPANARGTIIGRIGPSCTAGGEIPLHGVCEEFNSLTVHFIDSGGTKRKGIKQYCPVCKKVFVSRADNPKKTCSTRCRDKLATKRTEVSCSSCGRLFYKKTSGLSKSKSGLFFCCRKCKDTAQRIGGIEAIMPSHYGTASVTDYRSLFTDTELICFRCGYKEFSCAVEIHHKDHNRSNNNKENLLPLFANCHTALHKKMWCL
jgi:hypothetical protein